MKPAEATLPPEAARFRRRLFGAMLGVIAAFTAVVLFVARNRIARDVELAMERDFDAALATLHRVSEQRHAVLLERSRTLARRSRIHAALEDDAVDLLYPSARDELRDAMRSLMFPMFNAAGFDPYAHFYRFLDARGAVIPPPAGDDACGTLAPEEERQLALRGLPDHPQMGFLATGADDTALSELIATPILSTATDQPIGALVFGFEPIHLGQSGGPLSGLNSGIWVGARISLPHLEAETRSRLIAELRERAASNLRGRFAFTLEGEPHLVFYTLLNARSMFPPAYEVCVFSLAAMQARQRRITWQILGMGALLLLGGFVASHQLARRFARPVAALAHDSHEQRAQRQRAEAELETTSAELERAARFSADASHQLKTPVTVMRAGLEELLARGTLPAAEIEEVSTLIHQTYRLSTIIDDLLLLSRMDAGQLRINDTTVDLALLIAASLDDLEASPDEFNLTIESDVPPTLGITGEKRYVALILQNLLENARKYNRPAGRIRVAARVEDATAVVTIGNTTRRAIPPGSQAHIFERFHRGAMGENVPGYGIGLNLARDLARLHQGELRLVGSTEAWTEFEVRFPTATIEPSTAVS